MNTGQTLFVFGHEMGHYVLGHVWIGIGAALLGILIFLFLAYHAMRWALERNADIYGLEVIHGIVPNSSEEAAEAFQILGEVSLDDPNPSPFIEFWLYDHPSISERVSFASEYDPWGTGQPPKYVR